MHNMEAHDVRARPSDAVKFYIYTQQTTIAGEGDDPENGGETGLWQVANAY
jgi:hypothetical protein